LRITNDQVLDVGIEEYVSQAVKIVKKGESENPNNNELIEASKISYILLLPLQEE
jgi:predicted polyphosphate/ATP-dependent NAD kinase